MKTVYAYNLPIQTEVFDYETNTIGMENGTVNVDDIVETANHFKCIDMVIDAASHPLREAFIKQLHLDTCLTAQDNFKKYLDYFRAPYEE